jgi:ABC-2 type transport system ATP-binding protein
LLSTHILSEVESTCDRAIVIDRGRLVAEGSLEELQGLKRATGASLLLRGTLPDAKKLLSEVDGVAKVRRTARVSDDVLQLSLTFEHGARDGAEGLGVREATLVRASLEDVFAKLTRSETEVTAEDEEEDEA